MTYVSCYYHAFQGAQQVPDPFPAHQQQPQAAHHSYQQPIPYYNNRDNVTKSFHPHSTQYNSIRSDTRSDTQSDQIRRQTDIQNSTQRHIQEETIIQCHERNFPKWTLSIDFWFIFQCSIVGRSFQCAFLTIFLTEIT